jgi:hypothetical protein
MYMSLCVVIQLCECEHLIVVCVADDFKCINFSKYNTDLFDSESV